MKLKTHNLHIGPYTLNFEVWGFPTWVGFFLAAAVLIGCAWGYSPALGMGFACLFCLTAVVRIRTESRAMAWALQLLWLGAMLVSLCIIAPAVVGRFTFFEIGLRKPVLNVLCCVIVCACTVAVTGSWRWGTAVGSFLLLVLAMVNSYVYLFRERELALLDIFTATTAMKVARQYNYTPTPLMLYGCICGFLAVYAQFSLPALSPGKRSRLRLGALAAAVAGSVLLYFGSTQDNALRWNNDGSAQNGTYLNIFLGMRDSRIKPPAGYDAAAVDALAQEIPQTQGNTGPNIMGKMNEAYCDLDAYPGTLATNIPVTPFWDSFLEHTVHGYTLTSVYGGNTANSEFELLTGTSMAFLPTGAVPYNQYIRSDTFSLAWLLRSYGYTTLATHNYHASGWDRDQVYPRLGFQQSTFLESYPQEDLLRGFVSDREQYAYLLELLDAQQAPTFLFAVTMQNHGGYENEQGSYRHTVTLTDMEDAKAEQYLSLLNESDNALSWLIGQLQQRQEDTIVLFFGDHQPKLDASFYEKLNGSPLDTLPEQMRQHTVPFAIWANYDLQPRDLGLTSLNFLSGHLLDAAGVSRGKYLSYLGQLEQTLPAINLLGYWSQTQQAFLPFDQATGQEAQALRTYQWVQYNQLFDRDNRSEDFFSLP